MRAQSIIMAYPHGSRNKKRGMRIIHPELYYEQSLAKCDLCPLSTRRQVISDRLFRSVIKDDDHKLKKLWLDVSKYNNNLGRQRKFKAVFKTNRFRDSFTPHHSIKEAQKRIMLS